MTTTNYTNDMTRWKNEQLLKLAEHFHCFCGNTFQHKRVDHFEIDSSLLPNFTEIKKIDSMKICLAIKEERDASKISFYPILELQIDGSPEKIHFPLKPKTTEGDGYHSAIVPGIFRDMILANWNNLEMGLIDDLFIAQGRDEKEQPINQMVRVHEFIIDKEQMVPFIDKLNFVENGLPNITNIKMYPGVDMNKFGHKEMISFTPVLGFTHEKNGSAISVEMDSLPRTKKETFIEYSFPCPPTCNS